MEEGDTGCEAVGLQVRKVVHELRGRKQTFVADEASRKGAAVRIEPGLGPGVSDGEPGPVQECFRGRSVAFHFQNDVFNQGRAGGPGVGRGGVFIRRNGPEAEERDGTAGEVFREGRADGILSGLVLFEREHDADGETVFRLEVPGAGEVIPAGDLAEVPIGEDTRQTRAVAGLPADAATVFHRGDGREGFDDDLAARFAVFRGHATDAAGVRADVVGVKEFAGAYERPAVRHGRAPSLIVGRGERAGPGNIKISFTLRLSNQKDVRRCGKGHPVCREFLGPVSCTRKSGRVQPHHPADRPVGIAFTRGHSFLLRHPRPVMFDSWWFIILMAVLLIALIGVFFWQRKKARDDD